MLWGRGILAVACVGVLVVAGDVPSHPTATSSAATGKPPDEVTTGMRQHKRAPVWIFPDVLDAGTREFLFEPESAIKEPGDARDKYSAGGVPGSAAEFQGVRRPMSYQYFTFTNVHRERTRLLDVRAVVLERRPALTGTVLKSIGADGSLSPFGVDLDAPDPRVVLTDSGRPLFDVRYSTLDELESVTLGFEAFTSVDDCLWEVRLTLQREGSEPEVKVIRSDATADGEPFRTTAWNFDWPYAGGIHEVVPIADWRTGG